MDDKTILIGNSFPLSLVRRNVRIENVSLPELQSAAAGREVISFWGHENSLEAAERWSGLMLHPREKRPALSLDADGSLVFEGRTYQDCWVLSPDCRSGFRPAIGVEVQLDEIINWHVLHIIWE